MFAVRTTVVTPYFNQRPRITASPAVPGGPLYVSGGSNISQ